MTDQSLLLWVGLTLFIVAMLALDTGLFHPKPHIIGCANERPLIRARGLEAPALHITCLQALAAAAR